MHDMPTNRQSGFSGLTTVTAGRSPLDNPVYHVGFCPERNCVPSIALQHGTRLPRQVSRLDCVAEEGCLLLILLCFCRDRFGGKSALRCAVCQCRMAIHKSRRQLRCSLFRCICKHQARVTRSRALAGASAPHGAKARLVGRQQRARLGRRNGSDVP